MLRDLPASVRREAASGLSPQTAHLAREMLLALGSCAARSVPLLAQQTREQLEQIVRITGKPEKTVLHEVVTNSLKTYHKAPSKSAKAVLNLIEWAEQEHITGKATDVSTNYNMYAWEE